MRILRVTKGIVNKTEINLTIESVQVYRYSMVNYRLKSFWTGFLRLRDFKFTEVTKE